MKKKIADVIKRIYIEGDYDFFRKKLEDTGDYFVAFEKYLKEKSMDVEITISYDDNDMASITWYIEYNLPENSSGGVKYRTIVAISKIFPVYNLIHDFEIEHGYYRRIEPTLNGFGDLPYIFEQYDIEEIITTYFSKLDLLKLSSVEMDEVIPFLKIPAEVLLFGSQMTVGNALFNDLYNIGDGNTF